MAANESLLNVVHDLLAEDMKARFNHTDEDGNVIPLTAQEWNAIAKFLKDNHIEAEAIPDSPMGSLLDSLPDSDDFDNVVSI